MPLETAPVGSPGFGRNIAAERAAGKPEDQAVAIAYSKAGEREDAATAETERKWKIVGHYPNGNKLQFSVLAFDHTEAKRKAEAKKGGAEITDVVLWEGSRKDSSAKLDSLFQAADALYARSDSMQSGTWADRARKDGAATSPEVAAANAKSKSAFDTWMKVKKDLGSDNDAKHRAAHEAMSDWHAAEKKLREAISLANRE